MAVPNQVLWGQRPSQPLHTLLLLLSCDASAQLQGGEGVRVSLSLESKRMNQGVQAHGWYRNKDLQECRKLLTCSPKCSKTLVAP